jgi:hypothetical protein
MPAGVSLFVYRYVRGTGVLFFILSLSPVAIIVRTMREDVRFGSVPTTWRL